MASSSIYSLSLHDALPISPRCWPRETRLRFRSIRRALPGSRSCSWGRSEEHTSELQSPCNLVCRLLLEKKKNLNHMFRALKYNDLNLLQQGNHLVIHNTSR